MEDIRKGLQICLNATNLTFRGKHYKQFFDAAVSSPVFTEVANLVMEDVEKKSPVDIHSPPKIWKRYDTFVKTNINSVEGFLNHLNTIENSMKFTIKKEADHILPFLDTLVRKINMVISPHQSPKPTDSNRYLNFHSDHTLEQCSSTFFVMMHPKKSCDELIHPGLKI